MSLLILFLLPSAALSLTNDTHTNTTTADQKLVGWESPNNHRSTSEIIWSCLAIFLACTWKCMHLNIPGEKERGTTEWVKVLGVPLPKPSPELRRRWLKRVGWMFVLALAPELGVMISVDQRHEAEELYDRHKHMDWSVVHAYYANMGGFSIAIPEEEGEIEAEGTSAAAAEAENITTSREIDAQSQVQDAAHKGEPSVEEQLIGLDSEGKKTRLRISRLQPSDLRHLEEVGLFPATKPSDSKNRALPITTIDDIQDRSKSDAFTKFFALLQCTWLVIQSIARAFAGLPITELELTTLAFIFCAFIMYWFWWDKPFDIQTPTILLCPPEKAKQMREFIKSKDRFLLSDGEPRFHQLSPLAIEGFLDMFSRSVSHPPLTQKLSPASVAVSFYLTAFVFAGLHLIAWNWTFPTPMTRTMWRAFSLMMLTSSLLPMLAFWTRKKLGDEKDEDYSECCAVVCSLCCCSEKGTCGLWLFGIILFLSYVVARLGILFLVFYCFRAMPADVYAGLSWTAIFPHFS